MPPAASDADPMPHADFSRRDDTRFLHAIFEQAAVGIAQVALDGSWLQVNGRLGAIIGYSPEELLARTFQEITYPPDLPADLELVGQLLAGDISTYTLEKRYIRKDGSLIWINLAVALVRDEANEPQYFISVIEDISARKQLAEERAALFAQEQTTRAWMEALQIIGDAALAHLELDALLQSLLDHIKAALSADSVAILLLDEAGEWLTIRATRGLEEAVAAEVKVPFGQGVAGTIAARRATLVIDDLTQVQPVNRYLREQVVSLLGVPLVVEDRVIGVLHVDAATPRHFTQEEARLLELIAARIALAIDHARLYESERSERIQITSQAQELSAANEQMDAFLGIAGHELKTPLTAIQMHLQLMNRRLERLHAQDGLLPPALNQRLQAIAEQGAHMQTQLTRLTRLVNDLVDVSRIQSDRLEMQFAPVDLAALLRAVVAEQQQAAPHRHIRLDVPDGQGVPVEADEERVRQVVSNYLSNALKYSSAEQPVEVGLAVAGEQGRVWVRDEGPGIPKEEQARIWDRFHRVPGIQVQSGSGVGLGLGLHICRIIIEQHRGQVGVKSAPGRGATFWFTVPLRQRQPAEPLA